MKNISVREARQALSHLDEILAVEGELTITKRGRAIARVVRLGKGMPAPSHRDLREKMPHMEVGSEELVHEDRDAR